MYTSYLIRMRLLGMCFVVKGHVTDCPTIHHFVIPWTACYQVNDDTMIILS